MTVIISNSLITSQKCRLTVLLSRVRMLWMFWIEEWFYHDFTLLRIVWGSNIHDFFTCSLLLYISFVCPCSWRSEYCRIFRLRSLIISLKITPRTSKRLQILSEESLYSMYKASVGRITRTSGPALAVYNDEIYSSWNAVYALYLASLLFFLILSFLLFLSPSNFPSLWTEFLSVSDKCLFLLYKTEQQDKVGQITKQMRKLQKS